MKKYERIFRNSNDNDEIFDAFAEAISNKIDDINLYKILLGNKTLSKDEIIMFAEKICKEFPNHTYTIYMWVASIFQNSLLDHNRLEISFEYFHKASKINPSNVKPYLEMIDLYSYDIDAPLNFRIMSAIQNGEKLIEEKQDFYYKLAAHYKNLNDEKSFKKCIRLAEKSNNNNQ